MDWNLVVRSQRQESERRKEANIPWVMQRTNKALGQGLYHSHRHRESSPRGLEILGRKVSSAGFHASENQPEREIEKETERERER